MRVEGSQKHAMQPTRTQACTHNDGQAQARIAGSNRSDVCVVVWERHSGDTSVTIPRRVQGLVRCEAVLTLRQTVTVPLVVNPAASSRL